MVAEMRSLTKGLNMFSTTYFLTYNQFFQVDLYGYVQYYA